MPRPLSRPKSSRRLGKPYKMTRPAATKTYPPGRLRRRLLPPCRRTNPPDTQCTSQNLRPRRTSPWRTLCTRFRPQTRRARTLRGRHRHPRHRRPMACPPPRRKCRPPCHSFPNRNRRRNRSLHRCPNTQKTRRVGRLVTTSSLHCSVAYTNRTPVQRDAQWSWL